MKKLLSSQRLHEEERLKLLPDAPDREALRAKAKLLTPEQIKEKVDLLNRLIKSKNATHEIKVSVDPSIDTWACSRVPKMEVQRDGTIKESEDSFRYFIIMPYEHLAIDDFKVLLGELHHELGHAFYSDWRMFKRLQKLAEDQGYPPALMGSLTNCIEDPHMEHLSTLPGRVNGHIRKLFWAKNKALILPTIGKNLADSPPPGQFMMLLKLASLWAIHAEDAQAENIEQWDGFSDLHPDVQDAWNNVRQKVERASGFGHAMFPEIRSKEYEKIIKDLWAELIKIVEKHPQPDTPEGFPGDSPNQPPQEPSQEPPEETPSQPPQGGNPASPDEDFDGPPTDPDDLDNLPPEVQSHIKNLIEKYKQEVEKEAEEKGKENERRERERKEIEEQRNKKLAKLDGMTPDIRAEYNSLKKEAHPVIDGMKRIFQKYFPKIAHPKEIYGRKGSKYVHKEHMKRIGSPLAKPLAKPNTPEKSGFILQVIIDISGSMYMSDRRIDEAIKSVIGILEAAEDYPIYLEVLASDERHGGDNPELIIKSFNEPFNGHSGGKIKSRLIQLLHQSGGTNDDARSLEWAVPRIVSQRRRLRGEYEKIGALTIFLSDAAADGQQDPDVVNELRKQVPILGGVVCPLPDIKTSVEKAYGPVGEGSFCPDSLKELPRAFEQAIRKRISKLFRK